MNNEPIKVFNYGKHRRDFTYIDDIVEGIIRILDRPAAPNPDWDSNNPDPATSSAPYRVYNIGNNNPVELMDYIEALETSLGKKAEKELLPLQPGDVPDTYADVDDLVEHFDDHLGWDDLRLNDEFEEFLSDHGSSFVLAFDALGNI